MMPSAALGNLIQKGVNANKSLTQNLTCLKCNPQGAQLLPWCYSKVVVSVKHMCSHLPFQTQMGLRFRWNVFALIWHSRYKWSFISNKPCVLSSAVPDSKWYFK